MDAVSTIDKAPLSGSEGGSERASGSCERTPDEHLSKRTGSGPVKRTSEPLSILHACVHCRASKTACTDQRPCNRCCRLGLDCASDGNQPRKRACRSCHATKVACSTTVSDPCGRCQRLGIECVPRDAAAQGSRRKRARHLFSQVPSTADGPAQAAVALGVHLAPVDLLRAAYMSSSSPTAGEASITRLANSDGCTRSHGTDSPVAASSMFSVAASLLDLSRAKHYGGTYVMPGSPRQIMTL
jgi:hypothetical protein